MIDLDKLKGAAKDEKWDYVDTSIPEAAQDSNIIKWAYKNGLRDENGNIRDLAASILEKAEIPEEDYRLAISALEQVMLGDENTYARYRAAFALVNHGIRNDSLQKVVEEATQNPDVSEIAKKYLESIS